MCAYNDYKTYCALYAVNYITHNKLLKYNKLVRLCVEMKCTPMNTNIEVNLILYTLFLDFNSCRPSLLTSLVHSI